MQQLRFPLTFEFKIGTFANDFSVHDADGRLVGYVRAKMFKLKEDVEIFSDEQRTRLEYRIKADRWLDFNSVYTLYDRNGSSFGRVARKGWRSIWKTQYEIIDQHDQLQFHINEENPWVKVGDSLLGEVPILGMFTGYFFNPTYLITDAGGKAHFRLSKEASFWGRRFRLERLAPVDGDDDDRVLCSVMMMLLMERRKG